MGRKVVVSTRDCHIYKLFLMAQVFGKLEKTLMVVIPPRNNDIRILECLLGSDEGSHLSIRSSVSSDSVGAEVSE